jgi:hypothetical protein
MVARTHNGGMDRWIAASIAGLLALAPWLSSRATEILVYRCTGSDGAVALQDVPCPSGDLEERRALRGPPPGVPTAMPRTAAPPPSESVSASDESLPEPAPRRVPAPMFECRRHDGSVYESNDGVPQRHWVPLWVLGLDPRAPARTFGKVGAPPAPPPRGGPGLTTATSDPALAYGPGTWVEDRRVPLPPAEACERRGAQLAGLGRRIFLAQQRERDRLRGEQRALRDQLRRECPPG